MKATYLHAACLLGLAATFVGPQAQAQTADPASDESESAAGEIIVTAQRRSESVQKVPIAITALDSQALLNAGVTNTQQLAQISPSMVVNVSNSTPATYIRGVGTRLTTPGLEPSVATYIDDRYEGFNSASLVKLLDVQRVEVVKGPQGVLFGRNATGGAVRIITNDPVQRFEGNVSASYGNYDAVELRGTVNLPVTETFATRFSGLFNRRDGYVRNIGPTGLNSFRDDNFLALRAKALWDITPDVTAKFSADYFRQRGAIALGSVVLPPYNLNPLIASGAVSGRRPGEAASALTTPTRLNEFAAALRIDADLGGVILASITTYSRPGIRLVTDIDSTNVVANDTYDYNHNRRVFTQELQLLSDGSGPLQWLAGGFYLREKAMIEALVRTPGQGSVGGVHRVETETAGVFGQLTYAFGGGFSAILGGRYGTERKELDVRPSSGVPNLTTTTPISAKTSFSKFTPRAVLQWEYSPTGMLYASYSRGIKGGGFSFPAVGQPILRPEVLDSYEIGWKADLLDNSVRISSAAFYYNYRDLQVSRNVVLPSGVFSNVNDNAANSTVKGIEADVRIRPVQGFTISVGGTYLDAKYDDYLASARIFRIDTPTPGNGLGTVAIPFNAAGRQMLATPKFAGFVSAEYARDIGDGRFTATTTLSHKSSFEFDFVSSPNMSALRQKAYQQLSARLSYDHEPSGLTVSVFGNNLANKFYLIDASVNAQGPKGYYSDPRTYGVEVGFRF